MLKNPIAVAFGAGTLAMCLGGCSYVKRDELTSQLAELRSNDAAMRSDIDALEMRVAGLETALQQRLAEYDAKIERLGGRIRVDMTAHFEVDDATVREADQAALQDFASVIRAHSPSALVTVEGFTDPSGSAAYNKRLGQRRAEAVRSYLVQNGLSSGQLRAVSYGEDRERLVKPGASGEAGAANRRVALVIDDATAAG